MQHRNPLAVDPIRELDWRRLPQVDRVQRGAVEERAEDIHHRRVEPIAGEQGQLVARTKLQVRSVGANEVQDVAMVLHDTLGLPRGAGRVEDVRRCGRRDLRCRPEARRVAFQTIDHDNGTILGKLARLRHVHVRSDERDRLRVAPDLTKPGDRRTRIQRHVRVTRLQRTQDRSHHRLVVPAQQRDPAGAARGAHDRASNAVGVLIQLSIGPDGPACLDRDP